jgi:2-oxo-hept-3-ene-1,7-dioate hydratase
VSDDDHRKAAEAILKAERDRVPCPQLSKTFPGMAPGRARP